MGESQTDSSLSWPPNLVQDKQTAIEALTKAIQTNPSLQPKDKRILRKIRDQIPDAKPVGESKQK